MTTLKNQEIHKVKTITLRIDEWEFIQVALATLPNHKIYDNLNNRLVAQEINKRIHKGLSR